MPPQNDFSSLQDTDYDLAIIGGGINGAAIARDAALRGLKVILLEKEDFGSGASTKTSKLAHGGLRYLEQWEFSLVKEALHERNLLLQTAPHLVHPLKFVFPVYKTSTRPLWQVNLALYLYDFLAQGSPLPRHSKISAHDISQEFPGIISEGLSGGCVYYDAQMKDNRLVIENVFAAEQAGAAVLNYAQATHFLWTKGHVSGVAFKDLRSGREITIRCKLIVNATGAWSNEISHLAPPAGQPRVAPSKGVHLVIPKQFDTGLILQTPQDQRIFFILPWEKNTLIGATDTFYDDDADQAVVEAADVRYLLDAFSYYFPTSKVSASSIISTFVGLRPLVAPQQSKAPPSSLSRDCCIHQSHEGVTTLLGGKYTTYRRIAEDVVDLILKQIGQANDYQPCRTSQLPLPGALSPVDELQRKLEGAGLKQPQIEHLLSNYGMLAQRILEIIENAPQEIEQICSESPHILAEISYAIACEHAQRLEDWFYRRTSFGYTVAFHNHQCVERIAQHFAKQLSWNPMHKQEKINTKRND